MLNSVFSTILDMTVTGSMVILIVLAARLLLKRMPKILSYCLWAAVLFRLLCPVSISLPVSAVPEVPSVKDNYTLSDTRVDISDVGQAAYDAFQGAVIGLDRPITVPVVDRTPTGAVAKEVTIDYWELAVLLGQYVWILGINVMAVVSFVSYIKLKRQLAEAVRLNGNIHQVDSIPSPFVMGLLRPKIYLPSGLTEQEKEYVLLHERHHIHRGDHIIKAVSYAALCLHWFNPLVWIAFTFSGQDMEMSCDEAVLKTLGGDVKADYASSLLRFSVGRTTIAGAPLAFGEGDAGKRIRNLKKWKKPILWIFIVAAVLCAIVLVICLVNPNGSNDNTTPLETSVPASTSIPPETTVAPTTSLPLPEVHFEEIIIPPYGEERLRFEMPEFPGIGFSVGEYAYYRNVCAEENGESFELFGWTTNLYLIDLNGDGYRELCGTSAYGSGWVDYRIYVYDFRDNICYNLNERFYFHYSLIEVDGTLMVKRIEEGHHRDPDYTYEIGTLTLQDRQLYYLGESVAILGNRESPKANIEEFKAMLAYADQSIPSTNIYSSTAFLPKDPLVRYYRNHEKDLEHGIEIGSNGNYVLKYGQVKEKEELFEYFYVIGELSRNYDRYWHYDATIPDQMIVCTEYRDLGYRTIEAYVADLLAGKCNAHEETYIIRLDELAIYRWGSDENLYNDIVS